MLLLLLLLISYFQRAGCIVRRCPWATAASDFQSRRIHSNWISGKDNRANDFTDGARRGRNPPGLALPGTNTTITDYFSSRKRHFACAAISDTLLRCIINRENTIRLSFHTHVYVDFVRLKLIDRQTARTTGPGRCRLSRFITFLGAYRARLHTHT